MKKKMLFLFMAVLLLIATACSDSSGNAESSGSSSGGGKDNVVKIGSLHPLSGGLAMEGQEMRDAIRLAVEETNEAGGIQSLGGAKVELVEADHEGAPEKGVSEVNNLERAGVLGIIGTYASGVALPATQEAERSGIPFVIDIGSADELTERGFKYTFRLQPPATSFSKDFLNYYEELNKSADTPLKTAVLIHEDSVFGSSVAKAIEEHANEYGLEVLATLPHAASAADLSSTINRVKSLNPDIVATTTYLRDGVMLVEGLHNAGVKSKAIIGVANGAFSNASFITDSADINNLIMDVNYSINPKSELTAEVKAKFKEKYNKNLGPNAAYSYMAAKVLIDAIERAGKNDRDAVQKALTETDYHDHILPQDSIKFDEKGQNMNASAVLNQIFDGETKVVYPEAFKEEDPVYPAN
ncbi:ABC transporter substrate-binding protein [Sporosarcina sp. FSL W7-1349]|uniref:ABC transporter substrate-binding protein n=1 Tax=Sporosarcina sp. FSL W7-1349 TaxID=2921561 RepID=UPI0030F8DAE7